LLQQDLVGALAELGEVKRGGTQPGAAGVDVLDRRPWQEDLAAGSCHDQAGYRRVALTDGDDEIGDGADGISTLVTDRSSY
jgi:hypothetical protein